MMDLQESVWCLGDSFTVGLGQPWEQTWPQILQKKIKRRTINVSMDGASNDWIARRALQIISEVAPRHIVIVWSYTHRRESTGPGYSDEKRRIFSSRATCQEDYAHFLMCLRQIQYPGVLNYTIPAFRSRLNLYKNWNDIKGPDWPKTPPRTLEEFQDLPAMVAMDMKEKFHCFDDYEQYFNDQDLQGEYTEIPQVDFARDGHHFGVESATGLVDLICHQIDRGTPR